MEEEPVTPAVTLDADAAGIPWMALTLLCIAMFACLVWQLWTDRARLFPEIFPDNEDFSPNVSDAAQDGSSTPEKNSCKRAPKPKVDVPTLLHTLLIGLGQTVWALPFAILLGVAASWCAAGNIALRDDTLLGTYSIAMCVFGLVALARRPLVSWFKSLPARTEAAICIPRDALALIIAAACSVIALELPYNDVFPAMGLQWVSLEFVITLAILVLLYFLTHRFGVGPMLGVAAFAIYGIAQHFVSLFKSAPILPSDLLALGTAMEVSGGYTYELNDELLLAIITASGAICLLMFVRPAQHRGWHAHTVNIGANLCLAAACLGGMFAWYVNIDFGEDLHFAYDYWWPLTMYTQQGSLPSFAAVLKDLPIDRPENYSDEQAEKIQNKLSATYAAGRGASPERSAAVEQFNQTKPTVIAIMNETFSDLSLYDGLRCGYTGPGRYNSLSDALARGSLSVSVTGGGTANTEFEFLTGTSLGFVGGGKYPYTLYNFSDVDSLAKQLATQGYKTTAMHPNEPNNWNRKKVYQQLGFEQFLSIGDFDGAPRFHSGVTDRATYDKIVELLSTSDEPQFIFDVTMQNHGGYEPYGIPPEQIPAYAPEGITDADLLSQLNVYLSCIEASDRDLASFLDQLRTIGKPVVVVFFGDHQPGFAGTLNDALFPDDDKVTHGERALQTTYTIWANYDVAGNDQASATSGTSASDLAAQTLDMIGAPLTDAQMAQLAVHATLPQLNIAGYLAPEGIWYALDADSPYRSLVDDLSRVQYLNFARAVE